MSLISSNKKCACGAGLCEHDFSPILIEKAESNEAKKFDDNKPMWAAAPFLAFEEVVKVMTFGAKKYGCFNYLQNGGLSFSRLFSAGLRHVADWWKGVEKDPESGLSPLSHACCCFLMALEYTQRGIGKDDRQLKGKCDK